MTDKTTAYHKISQTIHSSKNDLHLKTCSLMMGIFSVKYKDESIDALLKDTIRNKRKEIIEKRFLRTNVLC